MVASDNFDKRAKLLNFSDWLPVIGFIKHNIRHYEFEKSKTYHPRLNLLETIEMTLYTSYQTACWCGAGFYAYSGARLGIEKIIELLR